MTRAGFGRVAVIMMFGAAAAAGGCLPNPFTEIANGFEIIPDVRPALSKDGTVVAATLDQLLIGDGTNESTVDLAPYDLEFNSFSLPTTAVQIADAGDIVLAAANTGMAGCMGQGRGAYRTDAGGTPPTPLLETCKVFSSDPSVGRWIAMSPNGTVAVSSIVDGNGAVYRGPASGPLSVLRSGSGTFFNNIAIDVNDAGRVMVQMEYQAPPFQRGLLAFDTPEQALADIDTAVEKLGIGTQPPVAINSSGTVVFAISGPFMMTIGGMVYAFPGGVYKSTPTPYDTPKMLTAVADLSGDFCRFGNVDINASGDVVFEATFTGNSGCPTSGFDGIFRGSDDPRTIGIANPVVQRGDERLGGHQFFDSVVLGQVNDAGAVSFITTYSEPLADPYKVWRFNP